MQKNYVSENDTLFLFFSAEESASSAEMDNGIIADFAADGSIVSMRINNFARRKDHPELKLRLQRLDQIKPLVAESRVSYSAGKIAPKPPRIIMVCGPNGAGKSTAAPDILQGGLKVDEFVNADVIAQGLSAFRPEKAAVKAGRVMLSRLSELAMQRSSFACETTLAARSFLPRLKELKDCGYEFYLMFFWLESPQLAVDRVSERVANGGHFIPDDVVLRRYEAGLTNFFRFYMALADHWRFYDNSRSFAPNLIASGEGSLRETVLMPEIWNPLKEKYS